MPSYSVGTKTATLGTDILVVCPPCDVLVPVLTGIRVTTGAQEQTGYVMSPLGIGWTKSFLMDTNTGVNLNDTYLCDDTSGTPQQIAANELVALTTEHAGFHASTVASIGGGSDITQDATAAFTFRDGPDDFDGALFELSDVDGTIAEPIRHAGVHFGSLAISNGATISDAKVRFRINTPGTGSTSVDYTAFVANSDDAPNPSTFAECARDLQTQTLDAQDLSTSGNWVEFDITSGLQSVVNRAGWSSGNSVNLFVQLDDIGTGDPVNTVTFHDIGSGSDPEIVVSFTAKDITLTDAPSEDVPYGSLVYYYGSKTDSRHVQLRFPANSTTTYDDLHIQGGVPTQRGLLAPASGKAVPMCVLVTNDTAAATVEWARFAYVDAQELVIGVPQGRSRLQFMSDVEVL